MKNQYRVSAEQATKWGMSLLTKCNVNEKDAAILVEKLVLSSLRGVDTHGLILIRHYARRFSLMKCRPIEVVQESETTCLIDAGDNNGFLVSTFAMDKVIEKAEKYGCGVASVSNSSHNGAAANYALMAAEKGMLGIAWTNGGCTMAPWGAKKAFLGNNPLSIAVPGNEYPITCDIALSTVAHQKIVTYAREGWTLPEGWAYDSGGNPTTDPQAALKFNGGILTSIGGYKGVCLSVLADLICGAMNKNGFAENITPFELYDKPMHVGHFFLAVKISNFIPLDAFKGMVGIYSKKFHAVPRKEGVDRLYMPGEVEYEKYCDRLKNGIPFSRAAIDQLNEVSDEFGIAHIA
jgi:LDH2 family malate/lactate/ureidoglycolate dehydrogenase